MSNIGMLTTITKAFMEGGVWMYAILTVHIFSIAIVAERVYALYFQRTKNQKEISRTFEDDIKTGKIEKVITKARGLSRSQPVAAVIAAGVQASQNIGGREEIQAKMDEVLSVENEKLENRTGFLAMLGNVGTLLGLLGTITGMIRSFAAVSQAGSAEKAQLLATGISEAMNCTAYGLIVAIPALVMYAVLTNRSTQLQEDLNQASTKAFNWLSFNYQNVKSSSKRA